MELTRTMLCLQTRGTMVGTDHTPSVSDSDYGKFSKLVVSGSCHSRCMMMTNEADWEMLKLFEKSKSMLMNAHTRVVENKERTHN